MRERYYSEASSLITASGFYGAYCPKSCDSPFGPMIDKPSIIKLDAPFDGFWFDVHADSVGQFTGKMDVNSKKVFEHDILQLYTVNVDGTRTKSAKVIVQWWENDQCYVLTTKEGFHCADFGNYGRPEYFEVIGNIHDNPELLEDVGDEV